MKLVTFARASAGHSVGDTRLVPDEVAARLLSEEVISGAEQWPPGSLPPAPQKPRRPVIDVRRPAGVPDQRQLV